MEDQNMLVSDREEGSSEPNLKEENWVEEEAGWRLPETRQAGRSSRLLYTRSGGGEGHQLTLEVGSTWGEMSWVNDGVTWRRMLLSDQPVLKLSLPGKSHFSTKTNAISPHFFLTIGNNNRTILFVIRNQVTLNFSDEALWGNLP